MVLLAINAEALGIAVFFAVVIAAATIAFALHERLLGRQVRERRQRLSEPTSPPRLHLVPPAAPVSIACQPEAAADNEEESPRRAA